MSSTLDAALRRAIRRERADQRLTQQQLAARMGWSRQVVTAIEIGDRALAAHELADVCRALDVSLLDLLSRVDETDRRALKLP